MPRRELAGSVRPEIGQRVRLSSGDIAQANKLYRCPREYHIILYHIISYSVADRQPMQVEYTPPWTWRSPFGLPGRNAPVIRYYFDFGAIHTRTSQPLYLSELNSHYLPPRSLRSSNANLLTRPAGITSNFSSRAFSVSAPSGWK